LAAYPIERGQLWKELASYIQPPVLDKLEVKLLNKGMRE